VIFSLFDSWIRMNYVEVELNNCKLRVYPSGIIHVKRYNRDEYYLKKDSGYSDGDGFKRLKLQHKNIQKTYFVHRIVGYAYHGLDIYNPEEHMDHINMCRDDNRVENLRLSTRSKNQWTILGSRYYWDEYYKKWVAQIMVNGKYIFLGWFEKDEEHLASECYKEAKLKYIT